MDEIFLAEAQRRRERKRLRRSRLLFTSILIRRNEEEGRQAAAELLCASAPLREQNLRVSACTPWSSLAISAV
jgi:hypothetical protein